MRGNRSDSRPKRSLGQNFLVDPNLQRKIADAIEPAPGDTVVEVGAGTGALTQHLAGRVGRLVAVELDDGLAAGLAERYAENDLVEVVHADVLSLDPPDLSLEGPGSKVIGNIPYNITSPVIFHFLQRHWRPGLLVVMMQREVADRILAPPGTREYGALSVGVRSVADVERLFHVGRRAFRPVPNVDSTVLRIRPHRPPRLSAEDEADLRTLTRSLFGHRRKQIQRVLRDAPGYALDRGEVTAVEEETGIDLTRRPESLPPEGLAELSRVLRRRGRPHAAPAAPPGSKGDPR